jgi:flagellar biosynthetic protein FliQ
MMEDAWVMDVARKSLETMLLLGGPLMLIALFVGLLVSVFQALTQINETTLTFIPKILAMGGAILVLGPWMLRILSTFTIQLYENLNLHLR